MTPARLYRHRWLLIRLPILALGMALAMVLWSWVFPMPPSRLCISTGQSDGAYHRHAQRYAQVFARHGVALDIQPSEGSGSNLQRLQAIPPRCDLALVQGGFGWSSSTAALPAGAGVQTLGSVDVEVLWLFTHERPLHSLLELAGLRVAAGPQGSGHRALLQRLLQQLQVQPSEVTLSDLSGLAARDALLRRDVDAVFMVAAPSAAGVAALLATPGVHLAQLRHTAALAERNTYLENRLLPENTLGPRLPASDTAVLTTPTHLLVREDLDPALKRLATAVAQEVHRGATTFHRAGELPSLRFSDFPSAPEARAVLGQRLQGLEAVLPFHWAQWVVRLLVIGLPLLVLSLLLCHLVPIWIRWRLEGRINRWYGELRFIEHDIARQSVNLGGLDLQRIRARLRDMETAIVAEGLPAELAQRCYTLRQHVAFVGGLVREYRGR